MRTNLLKLSVVLAAGMLMSTNAVNAQNVRGKDAKAAKTMKMLRKNTATTDDFNMYPCKRIKLNYNEEDKNFDVEFTEYFEYVKPGLVSVDKISYDDGERYIDFIKYNENDRICEEIYGSSDTSFEDIVLNGRRVKDYDPIEKDFCILDENFYRESEDDTAEPVWLHYNFGTKIDVERDELNRVLSVKDTNEDKFYGRNITHTYGTGNGPTDIEISEIDKEDGTEFPLFKYNNIEWEACDNQIFDNKFFDGLDNGVTVDANNRPSFYMYTKIYDDEIEENNDTYIVYDDKNRISEVWIDSYDENREWITNYNVVLYKYTDDFGSKEMWSYDFDDADDDGELTDDEMTLRRMKCYEYDAHGMLVKEGYYRYNNDVISDFNETVYSYSYDDKNRITIRLIKEKYSEDMDYTPVTEERYEYDDTTTGIASVNRENVDLKVNGNVVTFGSTDGRYVVCNADGKLVMAGSAADGWVSLENLPAGLYIVKVNGCAVKVIR